MPTTPALLLMVLPLARAQWTGILGLEFDTDGNKVDQRQVHCPFGFITGLSVRHGRDEKDDTDLYDFKLRCGDRWGAWSGMPFKGFKEEKSHECPMKMHVTGLEVKQGRREFGDVDTYDFRLQCSGVWQSYMGLQFGGEKVKAGKDCPAGTMAYGWRSFRGFVKRGDRDYYEFELNCKSASQSQQALRSMPNVRDLGLSQNVFVWSKHDVATWLKALGLGEHADAFKMNNLQGDVIFLLLESHLQDMGMTKIGDRLYFMEVLTQLHDAVNAWAKLIGQPLSSTRTLPNLQRAGLPLQVVGWSVKEVSLWVEALGLAEWKPQFERHRIQGDVMFSLNEPGLVEIGVGKIGDRLYLIDCLQSLHEEITSWTSGQDNMRVVVDASRVGQVHSGPVTGLPSGATGVKQQQVQAQQEALEQQQAAQAAQPQIASAKRGGGGGYGQQAALPGGPSPPPSAYGGGAGYGGGGAGYGGGGGAAGGGGASLSSAGSALLKQLLAQGYSMQEVLKLAQSSPALKAQLFR